MSHCDYNCEDFAASGRSESLERKPLSLPSRISIPQHLLLWEFAQYPNGNSAEQLSAKCHRF